MLLAKDLHALDAATRLVMFAGRDPDKDPHVRETPSRFLRALDELTEGRRLDPAAILSKRFKVACDEMIVVRGIEFWSMCEHHMLPFHGEADVAYVPNREVVGLSKVARLVHAFARRLQIQERLTSDIADAMMKHLKPKGVAVTVRASHLCMAMRGVKTPATMVTSSLLGVFRKDAKARSEFLALSRP